jgi:hypothetical protein
MLVLLQPIVGLSENPPTILLCQKGRVWANIPSTRN